MTRVRSFHVFDEGEIRALATDGLALEAAEEAFRALGEDRVTVPPSLWWQFPKARGEVHVKGAHIHGSEAFTFKVATTFFGNVEFGVPTGSGLVIVFDSETGYPRGILVDNGYLTELRTAAAGALAARLLTPARPLAVAVLGTGVQAHMQVRLLSAFRTISSLTVWGRNPASYSRLRDTIGSETGLEVVFADSTAEAVAGADLVITATASRSALVEPGWLSKGATLLAVGSDRGGKQELATEVLAAADKVVVDSIEQCARSGELRHAIDARVMRVEDVYAELAEIVVGRKPGREGSETIVCDLTGIGAQDAALAERVFDALVSGGNPPGD